jgi:hypothetical protein
MSSFDLILAGIIFGSGVIVGYFAAKFIVERRFIAAAEKILARHVGKTITR